MDEQSTSMPANTAQATPDPSSGNGGLGEEKTDPRLSGLQSALKSEREKRQAFETKLREYEKSQAEAERQRAEKQGEFEKLYKELKGKYESDSKELESLRGEKKARIERLTKQNADRLEALPEEYRVLVPEGLSPDSMADQIAKIEKLVGAKTASDETPRGGFKRPKKKTDGEPIPEEALREAKRLKFSNPRTFYEKIWKPRMERKGR